MNAIVALIPVSIALLIACGVAFFWAVDHGQFDDMDTPGLIPLEDDPAGDGAPGTGSTSDGSEPATPAAAGKA